MYDVKNIVACISRCLECVQIFMFRMKAYVANTEVIYEPYLWWFVLDCFDNDGYI